MAIVEEVSIILNASVAGFASGMSQAMSSLSGVGESIGGATSASLAFANMLINVGKDVINFGVQSYTQLQQVQLSFESLTGSSQKAAQLIAQLDKIPLPIDQTSKLAEKMLSIGFTSDQAAKSLQAASDASLVLGTGTSGMNAIVNALDRIQSTGKVTAMSFRPLATQGIDAWGMLAKYLGVNVTQAEELVKKGGVTAAQGIAAITEGLTTKFGAGAAKQGDTITSLFTRIKNNAATVSLDIGNSFNKSVVFTGPIKQIADFSDKLVDLMSKGDSLSKALSTLIPTNVKVELLLIAGAITGALVPAMIGVWIPAIVATVTALGPFIAIGLVVAGLVAIIILNWSKFGPFFSRLWANVVNDATVFRNQMVGVWEYVTSAVKGFIKGLGDKISGIKNFFVDMYNGIVNYLESLPSKLATLASNLATSFIEGFKKMFTGSPQSKIEHMFEDMVTGVDKNINRLAGLTPKLQAVGTKMSTNFGFGFNPTPSVTMPVSPIANNPMMGMKSAGTSGAFIPAPIGGPSSRGQKGSMGSNVNNETGIVFHIQQLVVREEADVQKIAQALFRKTQDRQRGRGQRG